MIEIFTDGASSGNPGPGGYGVVLRAGKHYKELSEGFRKTTNNRMELLAVIKGLEALKSPNQDVTIFSDSKKMVTSWLGLFSASRPFITASNSIRLLVVFRKP